MEKTRMPKLGSFVEWTSDGKKEKGYIWSMSNQPSSYWVIPEGATKVTEMKQIKFQRNYGIFFERIAA